MAKGSRTKVTRFSKRIVVFCLTFISLYTIAQVVLSYFAKIELSPTLTTCVYAFFGTELCMCVLTKLFDNLNGSKNKDNQESNQDL